MKQYTLHLFCTLHLLFMPCKTKYNHLKKKTQSSEEKKVKTGDCAHVLLNCRLIITPGKEE